MDKSSPAVRFLYGTVPGRVLLSLTLRTRADRAAVRFLRSGLSRPVVGWYARRHHIPLTREEKAGYGSFRDFFARQRPTAVDRHPEHLISPCDGWLSVHPIRPDSSFPIKGFTYRVRDLLEDEDLSRRYQGGTCLIFRLAASDYHHYCYIDDGIQERTTLSPELSTPFRTPPAPPSPSTPSTAGCGPCCPRSILVRWSRRRWAHWWWAASSPPKPAAG